jgi:hypothetical protein
MGRSSFEKVLYERKGKGLWGEVLVRGSINGGLREVESVSRPEGTWFISS